MRWRWHRRDPEALEAHRRAEEDLRRAQTDLHVARQRRPAVEAESRMSREIQRRNQFAAIIEQALRGESS